MFKPTHSCSVKTLTPRSSLKTLMVGSLLALSIAQAHAEQPQPSWNGAVPITWGECIPVPVNQMPPVNNMGMQMPFNAGFPMAPNMPAPANIQMPQPMFMAPPPGPFFDRAPVAPAMPLVPIPAPTAACDNGMEDKLNTLQEHYNLAAKASRQKIEELNQTLKDSQNQLNDSVASLEKMSQQTAKNNGNNQALMTSLTKLKTTSEAMISMQEKENADLKKQLEALNNRLNAATASSKNQAQKIMALGSTTKSIEGLKKQLMSLTGLNVGFREQIATLKAKSAGTNSLKTQLDNANRAKGELQAKLDGLLKGSSEKANASVRQMATLTQQYELLKDQLGSINNENQLLKGQLQKLRADDENKNKMIFGLKQSSSQLAEIQQAYQLQQNKASGLEKQLAEMEKLKAQIAELNEKLNKNNADAEAKLAEFKTVQSELESCKTAGNELSEEAKTSKEKEAALQAELDALNEKYKALTSSKDQLASQLAAATTSLASATADKDKDGVIDKSDKCPFTPEGTEVDATGCAADADNDGIADSTDKCPSSPVGSHVNEQGCPKVADKDKDGVADANDLCPSSAAGASVNEFGCTATENITLKGVNFRLGSAKLTDSSLPILDAAAQTLKKNPNLKIEVAGHTDDQGFTGVNQRLSQRRANTVMIYLIRKGVKAQTLKAKGYGEKQPIVKNNSEANRLTNRRVELKILK